MFAKVFAPYFNGRDRPELLPSCPSCGRVERERGIFRITASSISDLSVFVANSHQSIDPFLPPPLKFRTVGFPQYGFNEPHRPTFIASQRCRLIWPCLPSRPA